MSFPFKRRPAIPWITFYRPRPEASIRLFCIPFAGGSSSSYRNWSNELPPHIEVGAVQLPGREDRYREEPFCRIDDLVEGLVDSLLPLMRDLPFAFFGHSLGAINCADRPGSSSAIKEFFPVMS